MNNKVTSNNSESDDFNLNIQDSDYKNLITRLKEISGIISLLEKKYLDKF